MTQQPLLSVKNLRSWFDITAGSVRAVDDVSFDLERSHSLGLVGESGCGKTTTALSLMGMLPGNGYIKSGEILYNHPETGKTIDLAKFKENHWHSYRWKEISMIFQGTGSGLNPVKQIYEQIAEAIRYHYPERKEPEVKDKVIELFELVGLDTKRVRNYPHEFSGGMCQRVMIAMALACDPNLVLGDEPTTALDVMVQAQIIELINTIREKLSMSLIIITHDLSVIPEICDRLAVTYAGKIVEIGSVRDVIKRRIHPYTAKLIGAYPDIHGERNMIESIPGAPPNLLDPPTGCCFHPRCDKAMPICSETEPELKSIDGAHSAACHLTGGR